MYRCVNENEGGVCGNPIAEDEESQKIFGATGLCRECYDKTMREMYEPEQVAWEKLKATFPNKYISLKKEYTCYGHERVKAKREEVVYAAYLDMGERLKGKWGNDMPTPMEAVDNLIEKVRAI